MQVSKGTTLGRLIIFEKSDGNTHFICIQDADPQKAGIRWGQAGNPSPPRSGSQPPTGMVGSPSPVQIQPYCVLLGVGDC